MIKAKKGLLIALFAAMMVFVFGATSVFADRTNAKVEWNDDFTSVTVSGCTGDDAVYNRTYTDITKSFMTQQGQQWWQHAGQVHASINAPDVDGISQSVLENWDAYYYDLDNAVFVANNTTIKGEYANAAYTKGMANGLQFKAPSYVTNNTSTFTQIRTFAQLNAGTWQGKVIGDEEYVKSLATEQNFTLSLEVTYDPNGNDNNINWDGFVGVVPAKAVKVSARPASKNDVKFYVDEVSTKTTDEVSPGTVNIGYDGAAHKLVSNSVEGFTVSWAVYNKSTGKYDSASECPSVTNVGDDVLVKASINDTYPATDTRHDTSLPMEKTFTLHVAPLTNVMVYGFPTTNDAGNRAWYEVPGTEYDAASYVVAGYNVAKTDQITAALSASQADLLALFADAYDVTATPSKDDTDWVYASISTKKDLDKAALVKKHKKVCDNFGITADTNFASLIAPATTVSALNCLSKATIELNTEILKPDQVLFTNAPNMTYKYKTIKKKSKSFTVTAVAESGKAVTYKINSQSKKITINATTGKITVKKGLKKGTYKVQVLASTTKGEGYQPASSDWATLTIKVKK